MHKKLRKIGESSKQLVIPCRQRSRSAGEESAAVAGGPAWELVGRLCRRHRRRR